MYDGILLRYDFDLLVELSPKVATDLHPVFSYLLTDHNVRRDERLNVSYLDYPYLYRLRFLI